MISLTFFYSNFAFLPSCTGDFTYCEPSKLTAFGGLRSGGAVFSLESSTIQNAQSEYCQCLTGFKPILGNPGQCGVNQETPVRYIRDMEFDSLGPENFTAEVSTYY